MRKKGSVEKSEKGSVEKYVVEVELYVEPAEPRTRTAATELMVFDEVRTRIDAIFGNAAFGIRAPGGTPSATVKFVHLVRFEAVNPRA